MTAGTSKISVFIADDHPAIITGIKDYLIRKEDFIFSGSASQIEEMLEALNGRVNVLLLDVFLDDTDEFCELVKSLRNQYPAMRILILSGKDNLHLAKSTIENGANGFISKVLNTEEISHAIHEVYRYPDMKLIKIPSPMGTDKMEGEVKDLLTPREKQVISLLCRGFPNNREIAEILTGINGDRIMAATVQGHRRNIRAKLRDYGVTNDTSLGYWTAIWQLLDGTELSSSDEDKIDD